MTNLWQTEKRIAAHLLLILALAACDTPEQALERERSAQLDPAARADIISDPTVREGIYSISVYGAVSSIPPRMVYSGATHSIVLTYDTSKVSRAEVVANVEDFCRRNDFGSVTRTSDFIQTYQANITTSEQRPGIQIRCEGFNDASWI